jgi:CubicO group peptidase (beta-lactamase class C family)
MRRLRPLFTAALVAASFIVSPAAAGAADPVEAVRPKGSPDPAADPAGADPAALEMAIEGHARKLVEAANTRDEAARTALLRECFSEERYAVMPTTLRDLVAASGPLTLHHAETTGPAAHVFVKTGAGTWRDLQLYFEPGPPWRFTRMVFLAEVSEPVNLPNGEIGAPESLAWLNDYIDRLVANDDLSGGLLLVRDDEPILRRSFGHADAARTRPITDATRFNLGSGTKMFTAILVAMLAREGRIDLDDPIIKYIPEIPWREWAMKAKLRHLLTHTSGFGDYRNAEYKKVWGRITNLREVLPFALMDEPAFEPGAQVRYSNGGFLLLGLVIEKVTGEDYFDVLERRLYEPAGMASSGSFLRDGLTPDLADALSRGAEGAWVPATLGLRGTSAGGSYSTLDDIWRFIKAFRSGALLGRSGTTEMLQPGLVDPDEGMQLGRGFMLWKDGQVASFGHAGQAPGVNFEVRYYPGQRITSVIFSNQDNGAYDDLRKNVVKLVTGAR